LNWEDYKEFVKKVEVTPQHVNGITLRPLLDSYEITQFNRVLHASLGLCGEAAEVLELVKKCMYGKRKSFDAEVKEKLKDELSDNFFYLTLDLDALGLTLEDIMEHNKAKLSARYPELLGG